MTHNLFKPSQFESIEEDPEVPDLPNRLFSFSPTEEEPKSQTKKNYQDIAKYVTAKTR